MFILIFTYICQYYCWMFIKCLKLNFPIFYQRILSSWHFYCGSMWKYLYFLLHVLSGASDQRDLLLSQLEKPPAMELRRAAAGPQVQGGDPQSGKVFTRPADTIWLQPLTCFSCEHSTFVRKCLLRLKLTNLCHLLSAAQLKTCG